jgi:hypothetical protein
MKPGMISSQGTSIDQAIDLATSKYFDKKDKTNKLLVIISDGEDHSDNAESAAEEAQKLGIKIITVGVGTENGGTIPLAKNGYGEGLQKDKDGNVVVTKRNAAVLATIAKASKGGYVDGNTTKVVLEYVIKVLDHTEKTKKLKNSLEYILLDEKTGEYTVKPRGNVIQYFPRDSYHKIGNGTGCMTILFSGPWKKTWKEYIDGRVIHYSWNRKTSGDF